MIAGGFEKPVILAAGHANHAVGPEELAEELGLFVEDVLNPRLVLDSGGPDDGSGGFEIVSRAVTKAVLGPAFVPIKPFHAVALAADMAGADVIQSGGLADGEVGGFRDVGLGALVLGELSHEIHVAFAGAVAGFAGDPKFADASLESLLFRPRPGLAGGDVAADATHVPGLDRGRGLGVADEHRIAWGPTSIVDEPGERETDLGVAESGREPEHLHVMSTGEHGEADMDGRRG